MSKVEETTVTYTCDRCGHVWDGAAGSTKYTIANDGRFQKKVYDVDIRYYETEEVLHGHPAYTSAGYATKSREEFPDWCEDCANVLTGWLYDNGYFWDVKSKKLLQFFG